MRTESTELQRRAVEAQRNERRLAQYQLKAAAYRVARLQALPAPRTIVLLWDKLTAARYQAAAK